MGVIMLRKHMIGVSAAVLGAALLLAAAPSQAGAAELVQNGGFETGDLTGWTEIGNWNTAFNGVNGSLPHTGTYELIDGNYPASGLAGVSQQLATVSGQTYDISLYLDGRWNELSRRAAL
jgi:hypothetical protein